jgi:hypothetical protein
MIFTSTFLSHSSVDRELVEAIARELGRRGVTGWLDRDELYTGAGLAQALETAISQQMTLSLFLSEASVRSAWVDEELAVALRLYDTPESRGRILPIFLGDAAKLVKSHELLRTRWMSADGDRVNILGVLGDSYKRAGDYDHVGIAQKICQSVFRVARLSSQREVVIYLDQRGKGRRRGLPPNVPDNVLASGAVGLVFRPSPGDRTDKETAHGPEWDQLWGAIDWALAEGLGSATWPEPKKIRILGSAQLGFPFFLGRYFSRNTSADLYGYGRDQKVFTNRGQPRHTQLGGGNPNCESSSITPIPAHTRLDTVALLLSAKTYVSPVLAFLEAHPNSPALVWVENGHFEESSQVMSYIADVVALLTRLRDQQGLNTVHLYCGLPFPMVPLLAANLLHVVPNVVFMEYRSDLQGKGAPPGEMYVALPQS